MELRFINWLSEDVHVLSSRDLRFINWLPEDVHVLSTILPSSRDLRFINLLSEDVQVLSTILPSIIFAYNEKMYNDGKYFPLRASPVLEAPSNHPALTNADILILMLEPDYHCLC